jgi:hypothetical protein
MAHMTDITEFLDAADETTVNWIGLAREADDAPGHAQVAALAATHRDFEREGLVMVAVASASGDQSSVNISIHAFEDGVRVAPEFVMLGDELIITLNA